MISIEIYLQECFLYDIICKKIILYNEYGDTKSFLLIGFNQLLKCIFIAFLEFVYDSIGFHGNLLSLHAVYKREFLSVWFKKIRYFLKNMIK